MRRYIFILITLSALSCGKENMDPVFNKYPLIGTWISKTGSPVFRIINLKNEGTDEKYYEYTEVGNRMLRRTYKNIPMNYQIMYIDGVSMRVADRSGITIEMLKAE